MSSAQNVPKAAGIGPKTILQRIVHPAIAQLYLGNVRIPARFEPHRTGGFVIRGQDFPKGTADQFAEVFGVDKIPNWPKGPQYLLRFCAHAIERYETSFGGQTLEGAQKMGTTRVYPAPFLGTGYTPSENPVPEYVMALSELGAGTELWRIESNGDAKSVGIYQNRQVGWVPIGDVAFGPGRYWQAPVALRPTVRRGAIAKYQGNDYDVDFARQPGRILLHPLPGQPVPADFPERGGARFLEVADTQVDELALLRWRCTYKDAQFEVLDVNEHHAVLHFLGENYEVAAQLELTEVDFRQWRTIAPKNELTDPRGETLALARG